jgi:hypothetical protein
MFNYITDVHVHTVMVNGVMIPHQGFEHQSQCYYRMYAVRIYEFQIVISCVKTSDSARLDYVGFAE